MHTRSAARPNACIRAAAMLTLWVAIVGASTSSAARASTAPESGGPEDQAQLTGVASLATDDVWAVGTQYAGSSPRTLIEHWEGSHWSTVESANPGTRSNALFAVTAVSVDDVWAVGSQQSDADSVRPLIEHWDGASWSAVTLPSGRRTKGAQLNAVSADGPANVWAVGARRSARGNRSVPFAEHWDGTSWSVSTPQHIASDSEDVLTGVLAIAPNDVRAIGFRLRNGNASPLVEQWDGATWTIVESAPVGHQPYLWAIASDGFGGAWAVGEVGKHSGRFSALIERQIGDTWTRVPNPSPNLCRLLGVSSSSPEDAWAVGTCFDAWKPNYRTLTLHWNGTRWAPGDAWAVGCEINGVGDIRLHWNGADWTAR
jgi:hypothetical protein